jgi:tRNA/tmRNA/rRNA uracil-C5-methylase (TrmA/RlmC/RlmD family)
MSPLSISRHIHHTSFAYIRESHDASTTEYILNPPRYGNDSSTVATDNSSDDPNIVVLGGNTNTSMMEENIYES